MCSEAGEVLRFPSPPLKNGFGQRGMSVAGVDPCNQLAVNKTELLRASGSCLKAPGTLPVDSRPKRLRGGS